MADSWANVRLRAELHKQVQAAAEADKRSISSWLAVTLEKALKTAAGGER
jgi:predicted HicB family RNase H-like nuclease